MKPNPALYRDYRRPPGHRALWPYLAVAVAVIVTLLVVYW